LGQAIGIAFEVEELDPSGTDEAFRQRVFVVRTDGYRLSISQVERQAATRFEKGTDPESLRGPTERFDGMRPCSTAIIHSIERICSAASLGAAGARDIRENTPGVIPIIPTNVRQRCAASANPWA
jgi:hypothetical protein